MWSAQDYLQRLATHSTVTGAVSSTLPTKISYPLYSYWCGQLKTTYRYWLPTLQLLVWSAQDYLQILATHSTVTGVVSSRLPTEIGYPLYSYWCVSSRLPTEISYPLYSYWCGELKITYRYWLPTLELLVWSAKHYLQSLATHSTVTGVVSSRLPTEISYPLYSYWCGQLKNTYRYWLPTLELLDGQLNTAYKDWLPTL